MGVLRGPNRAPKKPGRADPEEKEPAIKTWGTQLGEMDAAWNPTYLKSLGTEDFRFGLCYDEWSHDLANDKNVKGPMKVADGVQNILKWLAPGVDTDWLLNKLCVRFKFPLRRYQDLFGNKAWAIWRGHDVAAQLDSIAPPMPIPPKKGWKRVWVSFERDNSSRTPTVVSAFWPSSEEGGPVLQELADTHTLRRLLKMFSYDKNDNELGQLNAKDLANAAIGKSTWWPARHDKAMAEYD